MKDLRQIIRESIILAENLQQADKIYFNTGILSPDVKRYILHVTQGDYWTKLISDIVYAELQQYEKMGELIDLDIFSGIKTTKKKTKAKNGIFDVSKTTLTLDDWKKIRATHNQLKAYNKNVFPIKDFSANSFGTWELIRALDNRGEILDDLKKLPSIAMRNMRDDIRLERNAAELQKYKSQLEDFLKYYSLIGNRDGKMKASIDKKIFSSNVTLDNLLNFAREKQNLVGGANITRKMVSQMIMESDGGLKKIYDSGTLMVIDVNSENGIKQLGCNSVWCFTYTGNNPYGWTRDWAGNSTNGHVYVFIDFSEPSDSPEFMHVLVKPLDFYGGDIPERKDMDNDKKLFNMGNQNVENPLNYINSVIGLEKAQKLLTFGEAMKSELNETKAKSKFQKLEDNKIPLTPEERKKVMDADAVWNFSPGNKPSPAVWKSKDKKTGKIEYVTNTHRAYQSRPTLKGAISIYHSFIKGTSE